MVAEMHGSTWVRVVYIDHRSHCWWVWCTPEHCQRGDVLTLRGVSFILYLCGILEAGSGDGTQLDVHLVGSSDAGWSMACMIDDD
jgi:hypothetical protein